MTIDHVLDTRGLFCPEPVMMLHGAVREATQGQLLQVLATDPSTQRDIAKFCQFLEHDLVSSEVVQSDGQEEFHFVIKIAAAT
ncbi:tRNA 2-thiouridine synthesizing protein A [Umboniibacter marinipuniceus]|uniref:tRNA 2-thiouridine synthesizing protein A n=2 Tax=Umboniibacter marinipuniceus TaxID=569599 RepID=A0A3M0A1N0_9GAMM|nr:tRNA 2-thiouridine synthesizing protein A [Umboniibacter marinipuniceus]